ncbi:hypothetical protein [Devosia sp. 2618]|uniref:helix-turn-helix transcriptional regulator n=1 Tax=Devosia sp. 2618 TaxID=3156454 RepID=UPI0033976629
MTGSIEYAVDLLFEAAVRSTPWSAGLDAVATSFNAAGAFIMTDDPAGVERGIPLGGALGGMFEDFVAQGWHLKDLRGQRAWPLISQHRSIFFEHELSTEEERKSHPYYQEFFYKIGMPWFAAVGFTLHGQRWALSLVRGTTQEPFDRADTPALQAMLPQLRRIITVASEVSVAVEGATRSLWQQTSGALLTVDFNSKISWASPQAINTLSPVAYFRGGRLQATDVGANNLLQDLIRQAIAKPPSGQPDSGAVLLTTEGRPAVLLEVIALPRTGVDVFADAAAIILVKDLVHRPAVPAEKLVSLLGLTRSEALVAASVGAGLPLRETATSLNMGYETARTHLSRIFQKLAINRQVELMLIIEKLRGRSEH